MPRRLPHHALGRVRTLLTFALLAGLGCGGTVSEPKPKPAIGVPVNLVVVTAPPTSIQVGGPQSTILVRVTDGVGSPVRGVNVTFKADMANTLLFLPDSATTNELGEAVTTMGVGGVAGEHTVTITAGSLLSSNLKITLRPGPPSGVYVSPSALRLYGKGDELTFTAYTRDAYGNQVPGGPVVYQVSDSTLLSVTVPDTPGGSAKVRSLRSGGVGQIILSGLPEVSTIPVTVFERTRTACTGVSTPQLVLPGALVTAADSVLCIGAGAGAQYALVVYNESMNGADSAGTTVTAYNVVPDFTMLQSKAGPSLAQSPAQSRMVGASPTRSRRAAASPTLSTMVAAPKLDLRFHERLLNRSRSLRRLFGPARSAHSLARAGSVGRIRGPSYTIGGSAPSVPAVDSLIALNVADSCTAPDMRTFRVEAVGTKAIVLADTANPTGGFTRADYQRFAARFDALVYPLDVGNFDAPTDIDGNDHVAILFTRAVNELTPANAGAFIGGFFNPRDLFPRTQSPTLGVCPASNEGEMFYMMVPDPGGTVNGNRFRLGFVDTLTTSILAHEFQHLINAGRRMYVNTSATDFEEPWLNEGLSHTAEELLYFRESGYTPRTALNTQSIYTSQAQFNTWVSDDATNFQRFFLYLSDPANHSPIDLGDDLETRGAAWAFLRFAVDQSFGSDVGVWQRFANSTTTGIGTLTFALQRDPRPLLRGFAVANSGASFQDPRFRMLSWNFPDVYSQVFVAKAYPLQFGRLQEATAVPVSARGGAASYYKFDVPPGVQALLQFGSSAAPANANLTFMVLRLQ